MVLRVLKAVSWQVLTQHLSKATVDCGGEHTLSCCHLKPYTQEDQGYIPPLHKGPLPSNC